MSNPDLKCSNCGYNPRQVPKSGVWYCPKCGRRNVKIERNYAQKGSRYPKKSILPSMSRDQVMKQLYEQLTAEKEVDGGYKEPYLNPDIPVILPIKRNRIKVFYKR
ncbi:MAG: hypothetical protein EAX86_00215 [Candidatus Heimdallarchaeota archaeon]|nr:hypothetical protein [Candidatus Heimdallarchaeota archaeon]